MQRARDGSGCRAPIYVATQTHSTSLVRPMHMHARIYVAWEQTYYVYVAICMHACMHTGRAPPCMRSIDLHIYAATVCTRALAILVDRAAIILYVLRATVHRTSFHPSDPWPLLADVIETKRRADRRNPSFPRPCLAGSLARSPPPPLTSHRRPAPRMPACMHATALFAVRTTAGMPFGRLPCSKPASARSSGRQKSY